MGYFTKMKKGEAVLFTDKGSLGSGRGYIWARSLPILKETLLLGKGADNYWAYFPRYDYVEAWKNGYYAKTISTPHNMYLQIGVNSGVVSLIAFLAFFVLYFVDSVRLYWKDSFDSFLSQAGLGLCLATLGYMLTGFLNDMMVCVAPVFWCLLGVGMAVNRLYRMEK
jgi:O-antigen ligase